jgi:methoxymalonate biosynthesis protein
MLTGPGSTRACINVAKQLRLAQLMGARVGDGPIGELVTSTSLHDAAEATAVVEAITEVAELKSKELGELCSLTSTIHVVFYA